MAFRRRNLLQGAAALSALSALSKFAIAEINLGNATLKTVSDGNLVLPGEFIFEPMPQSELGAILSDLDVSPNELKPECNLALLQNGERNVLFDVGSGSDFMPSAGRLTENLEKLNLAPEDITDIVFTHAHPDHIWGLLDDFDDLLFVNARYFMGKDEWDYWWNPNTVNEIGDARASFAVGAKRRLEAIEDQIDFFVDGDEILPGIAAVSSPGHTPGHMSFEIRHGNEAAMVLGDAIGNHHIAFRKPKWPSGSDQDQEQAIQTREMLFDRITNEDMKIIGFHLPDGGMGRVDKFKDGFVFLGEAQ